jgi:uncharacterized repeat protein (TIGR01451 family)
MEMAVKKTMLLVLALGCVVVAMPLLAQVTVELTGFKVVKSAGKEVLLAADKMKPGETIEYKAVYKNADKNAAANNVQAVLPVPAGMEFVPQTAVPAAPMASTDGVNYAKLPLMKKVKGADGQMHEVAVPYSEYRSLRWDLGQIPAGGSKTVSARMLLTSAQDLSTQKQ